MINGYINTLNRSKRNSIGVLTSSAMKRFLIWYFSTTAKRIQSKPKLGKKKRNENDEWGDEVTERGKLASSALEISRKKIYETKRNVFVCQHEHHSRHEELILDQENISSTRHSFNTAASSSSGGRHTTCITKCVYSVCALCLLYLTIPCTFVEIVLQ